jgi:hypothetical protein
MKIVRWLVVSMILFSVLFLPGCAPQEGEEGSVPVLSLSPTTGSYDMGDRCELVATVTQDGNAVSDVEVRFEMAGNSFHHPSNLMEGEFYEWEMCEWGEAAMYKGEHLRPLISEHWKKEKVYTTTSNYVYCYTGGDDGQAKFAYWGIYMSAFPGIQTYTDTIVVSTTVSGHELEETATITWQYSENTCVLDLISNTLSPVNSVVTPAEPLGNGKAVVGIDMAAGNFSVLEMKIEVCVPDGNWLLNIGNSPTCDGAGGDGGQFANDSELDVTSDAAYPDFILRLRASQYYTTPGAVLADLAPLFYTPPSSPVPWGCWTLRIKIADQKMSALVEETGESIEDFSSPFIFRLGGPDTEAGQNDSIYYAAFNRVISGRADRTGSGVEVVTFMWRTTWSGWEIP